MANTSWSGTRTPLPQATRQRIKRRDSFTCQLCRGARCGNLHLEVDHRVPVAEGGDDSDRNLWTLGAQPCHADKTRAERARAIARRSHHRPEEHHPGLR